MADDSKPAFGGGSGGTAGTGPLDATPDADTRTEERPDGQRSSLAGGDESSEQAIGEGGGERVAGTGSSAATSGRSTSEATGRTDAAIDPGDPGAMGGAGVASRTPKDRPPGGVSPIGDDGEESRG